MSTSEAIAAAESAASLLSAAQRVAGIGGWLHPAEGFLLMELARLGDGLGAVVELGSFMGLSTCWLAAGSSDGRRGPVVAVDTFNGSVEHSEGYYDSPAVSRYGDTFPAFEANLRRLGLWESVVPVVGDSRTAAAGWDRGPVRLLFIDADHTYEGVKGDFEAWTPHLDDGGLVAFHDVGVFPDVTRFYGEVIAGPWREIAGVESLRVVRRA